MKTNRDVYPDAITQFGARDRPWRVEPLPDGVWRVEWRSGVVTSYVRDPRPELQIGYEPGRHRLRPDIDQAVGPQNPNHEEEDGALNVRMDGCGDGRGHVRHGHTSDRSGSLTTVDRGSVA